MTLRQSSSKAEIGVVIVSWNTRSLLEGCLRSFEAGAVNGRLDVCVVDNASEDGSADLVRERFPWATLIESPENLGFGAAVNLAAGRTEGRWLAVANADVEVAPDALDALLSAAGSDPRAGALAPRLVLPDGRTQHSVYAFPSVLVSLVVALGVGRAFPWLGDRLLLVGQWDPERTRRVPWAIAAFLLVRRDAWAATGGFDPHQWMYAEDLELGWRLRRAGFSTRYVPHARVKHQSAAATTRAFGDERTARWVRSTYAWTLRRRGPLRTRAIAAIGICGALVRCLALSPLALVAPDPWRARRAVWATWARLHRAGLAPAASLRAHR
jgi:N-acetylglucosaminyl-diphospho-decaprenol L-rhamnosyltransferase